MDGALPPAQELYVSKPRSPEETDRTFADPGLFLVNPEGEWYMVDISNALVLRPGPDTQPYRIKSLLYIIYPIRGTHGA